MNLFVKPATGYKVRDPLLGDHLPPEGRLVEETPYWRRRIVDKDVSEDPKAAAAATAVLNAPAKATK